jgi:hypothetical protein
MSRRMPFLVAGAFLVLAAGAALPGAAADSIPSGERAFGQAVVEPVYNAESSGQIGYILTPNHAQHPIKANQQAWAPIYLPVYPVGSTVGPLLCEHMPTDNCPTHGDAVAGGAALLEPDVYGDGVIGHDHIIDFPGGDDFHIAWEPILVLFTSKAAANEHLLTEDAIDAAVGRRDAIEVPLPDLTFLCSVVPGKIYDRAVPLQ